MMLTTNRSLAAVAGLAGLAGLAAFGACSGGKSTATLTAACPAANAITLASGEAATMAADTADCLDLAPGTGTYIIVPQFATTAAGSTAFSYEIGTVPPGAMAVANRILAATAPQPRVLGRRGNAMQAAFDHKMRVMARAGAARLAGDPAARRAIAAARKAARGVAAAVPPPPLGSTRIFSVCADINCASLKADTAILKFSGTNILFYQSQNALPSPNGFSDGELTAFGNVFDQTLYGIDVNTFGAPSDIDMNGRVIILMSPKVNAITTVAECNLSGYVAGFFYSGDLPPFSSNGEIFYTIAPDPSGTVSCSHTKTEVGAITGAVFLHETLHLINYNQKVLVHGLPDTEQEWLDEGMAKVSEEMGSKHYEALFPPPSGRTNPTQLFPDAAEGYISGDLVNSYFYLNSPSGETIMNTVSNGSDLPGEGGEWLFLRWLGDQKGEAIYAQIVQSALVGIPNLEAQAGESFPSLFGKASLAFYTDSLLGVPRNTAPPAYRYTSRNLRQLYQALFTAVGGPTSQFPLPFPIALQDLGTASVTPASMQEGTTAFYRYAAPASGAAVRLHFSGRGGAAFPTALKAQVSVYRCPAGAGC